jgi:hypothetical protein
MTVRLETTPSDVWIKASKLVGVWCRDGLYPCLCWVSPGSCQSVWCDCWGRADFAVMPAACCARRHPVVVSLTSVSE